MVATRYLPYFLLTFFICLAKFIIIKLWERECCRLNAYIPPKSMLCMLKPKPQYEGVGRWGFGGWLGHECGALASAIITLVKEAPGASLNPSDFWGHSKKIPSWTRKKVLTKHQICWCLSLELAASRTLRNECLFRSQWYLPAHGILLQQLSGLRQWVF